MLQKSISAILVSTVVVVSGCNSGEGVYSQTTSNILPEAFRPIEIKSGDWPWWRGPNLDGTSPDADPPLTWSETKNIVWKTPVSGRGHSTPSIRGDRIFLQTADEEKKVQYVNCYRRDTGKELWSTAVHEGAFMPVNGKNTQASSTPACASSGRRAGCTTARACSWQAS